MKNLLIILFAIFISCSSSESNSYKLLSRHPWCLNAIILDSTGLRAYPYVTKHKYGALVYTFGSIEYRKAMYDDLARGYSKIGLVKDEDKPELNRAVENSLKIMKQTKGYEPDKKYYPYSYQTGGCQNNCFYRIDGKRLRLFFCGCFAVSSDAGNDSNAIAKRKIETLVDSISRSNVSFEVNDDSLVLTDTLNRKLIFGTTSIAH